MKEHYWVFGPLNYITSVLYMFTKITRYQNYGYNGNFITTKRKKTSQVYQFFVNEFVKF